MKRRILTLIVVLQAALFLLGAGIFSVVFLKPEERAVYAAGGESETIKTEAPADLNELRSAGSGQLDYWAGSLTRFDGRTFGYITPERNQGGLGICWAYAAVGAAEANILRDGVDEEVNKDTLNLDEIITAYVRYNRDGTKDPLFLTTDDTYSEGNWRASGGHAHEAFMAMSQGFSPVEQKTSDGYQDWAIKERVSESKYFVQGFRHVEKDREAIKRAILEYGSVTMEYKAPMTTHQQYLYYSDGTSLGHASLIVGWDDSIPSTFFSPQHPVSDGAWIVKNSWGSGGNQVNGTYCFYLAYDSYLSNNLYTVDMGLKEDYQNIYYYDGQITDNEIMYYTDAHGAIYEAKRSSATEQEQLEAVSFGVRNSGITTVDIKIYKGLKANPGNVNDPINKPDSGVLAARKEKVLFEHPGFYTVELDSPVPLDQGEYFSVVISGEDAYGNPLYPIYAAETVDSVNDMTYRLYGGQWTSFKSTGGIYAGQSPGLCVRLRALTNTVPRQKPFGNDLQYARVELSGRLLYYEKGKPQIPAITAYFGDKLLQAEKDYDVTILSNEKPGTATVTLTGKNGYTGTRTTTFEVAKPKYPSGAITTGVIEVYNNVTRLRQIPTPVDWVWQDGDIELKTGMSDFSYQLKYIGDDAECYQNIVCSVHINKLNQSPPAEIDISEAEVRFEGSYTYTGTQIVPVIRVTCRGLLLNAGTDYTATYRDNVNAGHATAVIRGNGKYYGELTCTFEIGKAARPKETPKTFMTVSRKAKTLNDVPLGCKDWEWKEPTKPLGERMTATAVYRGSDAGNYSETEVEIELVKEDPKELSQLSELRLSQTQFVYDGTDRMPEVIARDGSLTLGKGSDFSVSYRSNRNAGEAFATVTGQNDYRGSVTLSFTIGKAERTNFSVEQAGWTYGDAPAKARTFGEGETGEVTVLYSEEERGEYRAEQPTDAGTYWVKAKIEETQNYFAAEDTAAFTVSPKELGGLSGRVEGDLVYTGQELEPKVTVTDGERTLEEGVDFTVTYENNVNAGAASAKLQGKKNYTGALTVPFEIGKAARPKETPKTSMTVSRKAKTLNDVLLGCKDWEWKEPSKPLGERMMATAVYRGSDAGNYSETEVEIELVKEDPKELSQLSELRLSQTQFVYDGTDRMPEVIARDGSYTLGKGSDFSVSYRSNRNAGEAFATVTGQNDYRGSVTLSFTIGKAERTNFSVEQAGWTYGDAPVKARTSGEGETGEVTILYSEEERGEYRAEQPTDAGAYWVKAKIEETQNYFAAEDTAAFTVSPKELGGLSGRVEGDLVYTGQELEPKVTVKDGERTLEEGVDFTVTYENNVNAGAASAKLQGKKNYTGALTVPFEIGKAALRIETTIHVEKFGKLSQIPLPEEFVWDESSLVAVSENLLRATAVYTGTNYDAERVEFEIVVDGQSEQKPEQNPEQNPAGSPEEKPAPDLLWLIGAVPAALLLAGGVCFACVWRRRKRR